MTRFVPLLKRNKKAQRAYHSRQRGTLTCPAVQIQPSGKRYCRSREKARLREEAFR